MQSVRPDKHTQALSQVPAPTPAVCSYNEWDPLEEVIVGIMDGACIPEWDTAVDATMPESSKVMFEAAAGRSFPQEQADAAKRELDGLARALEQRGVRVRRPDHRDYSRPFATPSWSSKGGLYAAMPRDLLLVVGDLIIEAPMAWRSRYFEVDAYRSLLQGYFEAGARWISAPRPQLLDSLYDADYDPVAPYESNRYAVVNQEPTFDAADFIRCGRDIFCQRSHVTNELGIEWVRRHIGPEYTVHVLDVTDSAPMHLDASFMPLAPGKLLLNRERVPKAPDILRHWDIRFAPPPALPADHTLYMSSAWVSMNVLMLDEKTVVVEAGEAPLIAMFKDWGLEVVPVEFRNVQRFGGSFHCVTCDTRRRGPLQSYR